MCPSKCMAPWRRPSQTSHRLRGLLWFSCWHSAWWHTCGAQPWTGAGGRAAGPPPQAVLRSAQSFLAQGQCQGRGRGQQREQGTATRLLVLPCTWVRSTEPPAQLCCTARGPPRATGLQQEGCTMPGHGGREGTRGQPPVPRVAEPPQSHHTLLVPLVGLRARQAPAGSRGGCGAAPEPLCVCRISVPTAGRRKQVSAAKQCLQADAFPPIVHPASASAGHSQAFIFKPLASPERGARPVTPCWGLRLAPQQGPWCCWWLQACTGGTSPLPAAAGGAPQPPCCERRPQRSIPGGAGPACAAEEAPVHLQPPPLPALLPPGAAEVSADALPTPARSPPGPPAPARHPLPSSLRRGTR